MSSIAFIGLAWRSQVLHMSCCRKRMRSILQPFSLRRVKANVAQQLPPKHHEVRVCMRSRAVSEQLDGLGWPLLESASLAHELLLCRMRSILQPFFLRRVKADVAQQLPPKHHEVRVCMRSRAVNLQLTGIDRPCLESASLAQELLLCRIRSILQPFFLENIEANFAQQLALKSHQLCLCFLHVSHMRACVRGCVRTWYMLPYQAHR